MTLGEFTHLSPLPSLVSAVRQALRGLSLSLGPSLDFHRWGVAGTQPRVRSHIQCRHRSRNRASSGSLLCRTPIVRLANLATENLCEGQRGCDPKARLHLLRGDDIRTIRYLGRSLPWLVSRDSSRNVRSTLGMFRHVARRAQLLFLFAGLPCWLSPQQWMPPASAI